MRRVTYCGLMLAAGALTALGGCQMLGPNSIDVGRGRYNSIIQSTSMEQTMSNIVRVYNHEPPMFMDVTEVDATVAFTGSVTGASSNIGAKHGANNSSATVAGQVGSAGGTLQYSETPTIRYQPLLGQALVAQLVTPVSVDALGLLVDSYWDIAPVLDLSTDYLTLDYGQFASAFNTIIELNDMGALELTASRSSMTPKPSAPAADSGTPGAPGKDKSTALNNDSLVIYLRPFSQIEESNVVDKNERILQLWVRMLRIYADNQPSFKPQSPCKVPELSLDAKVLRKWDVNIGTYVRGSATERSAILVNVRGCLPDAIELRVVSLPVMTNRSGGASHAPLMRTFSALGILKNATGRPHPKIEFVTPQMYETIHGHIWNDDADGASFYTLLSNEQDSIDCSDERKQNGGCDNPIPPSFRAKYVAPVDQWIKSLTWQRPSSCAGGTEATDYAYSSGLHAYETPCHDVMGSDYIYSNNFLEALRRYMLIVVADQLPPEPVYVSFYDGERWFYIAKSDSISQKNFQLLSLFMSMMAIPPSTQPLSPVINVGG